MYRHLAAVVVTAVKSRMSDGERWSLERFRQDLLNRTAEPASRAEFQRWFDHRHNMLRSITRRLWQLATEQEPPLAGLWLALEARIRPADRIWKEGGARCRVVCGGTLWERKQRKQHLSRCVEARRG